MIQAGFARVDITPSLGTPVSGYFTARYAEGVRDPLEVNVLAFGNGTDIALILACDVVAITQQHADELRAQISTRTGVPADHVMISALHQHTSICVGGREIFWPVKDELYLRYFYRKLADAAQMAVSDMSESRVFTAERRHRSRSPLCAAIEWQTTRYVPIPMSKNTGCPYVAATSRTTPYA